MINIPCTERVGVIYASMCSYNATMLLSLLSTLRGYEEKEMMVSIETVVSITKEEISPLMIGPDMSVFKDIEGFNVLAKTYVRTLSQLEKIAFHPVSGYLGLPSADGSLVQFSASTLANIYVADMDGGALTDVNFCWAAEELYRFEDLEAYTLKDLYTDLNNEGLKHVTTATTKHKMH